MGVPGLMEIYKRARVALANAPGPGIADDKCIYTLVPKIIEYCLGEKLIIPMCRLTSAPNPRNSITS